jgi:hypothetical protein
MLHSPRLDAPNGPWLGCLVNGAGGFMDPDNSCPVPDQDKSGTTLVRTRRAASRLLITSRAERKCMPVTSPAIRATPVAMHTSGPLIDPAAN